MGKHVWTAARSGAQPARWSLREMMMTQLHSFGEDTVFCILTNLIGAFLLFKVMTAERPRDRFQPPPPPPKRCKEEANGNDAAPEHDTDDGTSPACPEDAPGNDD